MTTDKYPDIKGWDFTELYPYFEIENTSKDMLEGWIEKEKEEMEELGQAVFAIEDDDKKFEVVMTFIERLTECDPGYKTPVWKAFLEVGKKSRFTLAQLIRANIGHMWS